MHLTGLLKMCNVFKEHWRLLCHPTQCQSYAIVFTCQSLLELRLMCRCGKGSRIVILCKVVTLYILYWSGDIDTTLLECHNCRAILMWLIDSSLMWIEFTDATTDVWFLSLPCHCCVLLAFHIQNGDHFLRYSKWAVEWCLYSIKGKYVNNKWVFGRSKSLLLGEKKNHLIIFG